MADWAGLHLDILVSIVEKVRFTEDFVVFGAVCKSWREAASSNKQYFRPQIPWLMLPERENHPQICSLSKDDILPKKRSFPQMFGKRCIGLNYGWVLTVSPTGEMNLAHPLSRSQIKLPKKNSIENWEEIRIRPYSYMPTTCAALSANPSQTSDFALMIVHGGAASYLSYGRLGDKRWTLIPNQTPRTLYYDLTYYQDRFYGVENDGKVWCFNVSDPPDRVLVADVSLIFYKVYIVESEGDLLLVGLVDREYYYFSTEAAFKFEVYKLDLINGGHKRIKSLGDRAIFVGQITSISVDVSEIRGGLIKSNHIYLADVKGSYSLEDGQFTQFKVPSSLFKGQIILPFWFRPSF